MAFGKELSDILHQENMTVKELAELADIPVTTLYSLIKRDNNTVNLDYVRRICDILGSDHASQLLSAANLSSFINSDVTAAVLASGSKSPNKLSVKNIYTKEEKLLRHYHALNPEGQDLLRRCARDLYDLPRYRKEKD